MRCSQLYLFVCLLVGLCCFSPADAQPAPFLVYVAEPQADGSVRLNAFSDGEAVEVEPQLAQAEWQSFGLRGQPSTRAVLPGAVTESGGDLPRIRVPGKYQIVAFSTRERDTAGANDEADVADHEQPESRSGRVGGIAVVSSQGTHVLLESEGPRYRPVPGGAFVSPDQRFLAILVEGKDRKEIVLLELERNLPRVCAVNLPALNCDLQARSLTLIDGALLVVARFGSNGWILLRAPLQRGLADSLDAEMVSGPFAVLKPDMAFSPAGVAYLAGPRDDLLDVYVARAAGEPLNLTRCPATYLVHRPDNQRLAISDDGHAVGYSAEMNTYGPEPETFCHPVASPGEAGRIQLTADYRFQPYVEQEVFIFFRGNYGLVFSGGHPGEADFYLFSEISDGVIKNLTQTAGNDVPYGVGTLMPRAAVVTSSGLLLLAADGFAGYSGVVGVSLESGDQLFKQLGLKYAHGFFEVGADTYFVGASSGPTYSDAVRALGLYRVRDGELTVIASGDSSGDCGLLAHESDRALFYLEDVGLLELRPGAPPSTIVEGHLDPSVALSPCGRHLIYSRHGEYFALNLSDGAVTPVAAAPSSSGYVLAVGDSFLRGDASLDGQLRIEDVLAILNFLYSGRPVECRDAADANDDGVVSATDYLDVLAYLYFGGDPLPPPFPEPGLDPTLDGFSCCR